MQKTEEQYKKDLSPEEYRVLREGGTEIPFTGKYVNTKENGSYACRACDSILFKSDSKFESHCGWPSFDDVAKQGSVTFHKDTSHGMIRTEIRCSSCGSHLGHVFDYGPTKTGKWYCVNSVSLNLKKE